MRAGFFFSFLCVSRFFQSFQICFFWLVVVVFVVHVSFLPGVGCLVYEPILLLLLLDGSSKQCNNKLRAVLPRTEPAVLWD